MYAQYEPLTQEFLQTYRSRDTVPVQCYGCDQICYKAKSTILHNKKRNIRTFCTAKCCTKFLAKLLSKEKIIVRCSWCNKYVHKKPSDYNRSKNHFCNKQCSSSFASNHRYKHTSKSFCSACGIKLKSNRARFCLNCKYKQYDAIDDLSLYEMKYHSGPSSIESKWGRVRNRARRLFKTDLEKGCVNCGYNKHAEVCHIKSISLFPLSATVREVNDKSNIIILCRNCHWELDHGLLII